MIRYVVRRLLGSIFVLWAVITLVFVMAKLAPGDPAQLYLGLDTTPADLAAIHHQLGLDRPVYVQYFSYMDGVLHGDFGKSIFLGRPVTELVLDRVPVTLELTLLTIVFSSGLALVLGMIAASKRDSWRDGAVRVGTVIGISVPNFWLGLLLILVFGLWIPGVLPPGGWVPIEESPLDNLDHMILPVLVLGLPILAVVARTLRISMLDTLNRDYITFARAMGLPERSVLSRVGLPNAIIPSATVVGLFVGYLVGGAVIVEVVFTLPGVGQLLVNSFERRDIPLAIGTTIFVATSVVAMTFLVDMLYAYFNPRIRELYERRMRVADA